MGALEHDKIIRDESDGDYEDGEHAQAQWVALAGQFLALDFVVEIYMEWHGVISARLPRLRRRLRLG